MGVVQLYYYYLFIFERIGKTQQKNQNKKTLKDRKIMSNIFFCGSEGAARCLFVSKLF